MKSCLTRLSLVYSSNLPPSLQTLEEIPLDNIDENFISVVAHATWAPATIYLGLVISVHGAITIIIQLFPTGLTLQSTWEYIENLDKKQHWTGEKIWIGAGQVIQIYHKKRPPKIWTC